MTHSLLAQIAAVWLIALVVLCGALFVRVRIGAVWVLLIDLVTMLVVAVLVLLAGAEEAGYYVDVALAVALLSFVGTLAAARFLGRGRLFG